MRFHLLKSYQWKHSSNGCWSVSFNFKGILRRICTYSSYRPSKLASSSLISLFVSALGRCKHGIIFTFNLASFIADGWVGERRGRGVGTARHIKGERSRVWRISAVRTHRSLDTSKEPTKVNVCVSLCCVFNVELSGLSVRERETSRKDRCYDTFRGFCEVVVACRDEHVMGINLFGFRDFRGEGFRLPNIFRTESALGLP